VANHTHEAGDSLPRVAQKPLRSRCRRPMRPGESRCGAGV